MSAAIYMQYNMHFSHLNCSHSFYIMDGAVTVSIQYCDIVSSSVFCPVSIKFAFATTLDLSDPVYNAGHLLNSCPVVQHL